MIYDMISDIISEIDKTEIDKKEDLNPKRETGLFLKRIV
jgi:hypothetical protein